MSREDPYFRLRIPESLKAKVERASEENRRSMTAEIIARLERSFETVDLTELPPEARNKLQTMIDEKVEPRLAEIEAMLEEVTRAHERIKAAMGVADE